MSAAAAMSHWQDELATVLPGPSERMPDDCSTDGSQGQDPEQVMEVGKRYVPAAQAAQLSAASPK